MRLLRLDERDQEARASVDAKREAFRDVPDEAIERQTQRIMEETKAENRATHEQAVRSA